MSSGIASRRLQPALLLAAFLFAAFLLVGASTTPALAIAPQSSSTSAQDRDPYVGDALCIRCHEEMLTGLEASPHGGEAFEVLFDRGCQSCHGPGRAHVQEPENSDTQPRVGNWSLEEKSGVCASCHDVASHGSGHAANEVSCSDCHLFHDWEMGMAPGTDVRPKCQSCHPADSKWRFEGPHDDSSDVACTECHALNGEKLGDVTPQSDDQDPYVGSDLCVACHDDLLTSLEPSPHGGEAFDDLFEHGCQSCHGPGRAHVQAPDNADHQPRLSDRTVAERNQVCEECHGESDHASGHAESGVSCSGCHAIHEWEAGVTGTGAQERCSSCHLTTDDSSFAGTPHSGADVPCTECHALKGEDPVATGEAGAPFCLSCHRQDHPRFQRSPHAVIGCGDCHAVHTREQRAPGSSLFEVAKITGVSAQCAQCHEDVAAVFQFNERHRLQEGILDCTSCHDPHAPSRRLRLGGFKQQECLTCHADKGGPWVFEHGAQRVEGCVACHDPHGSPNRHLLHFQRTSDLCYTCHTGVPGFHTSFDPDRDCTECHFAIHGSNVDPALFQ